MDVRVGLWRKLSAEELILLNCGVGEDSWESLGLQGDPTRPFFILKEISPGCSLEGMMLKLKLQYFGHLMLTHWKRLWCLVGLGAGWEGDDRGWDGWMTSPTQWTWVWVNSGSWWWTGRPGVLQFMGSQRVGHDWATELNWTKHVQNEQLFSSFSVIFFMPQRYWNYNPNNGKSSGNRISSILNALPKGNLQQKNKKIVDVQNSSVIDINSYLG